MKASSLFDGVQRFNWWAKNKEKPLSAINQNTSFPAQAVTCSVMAFIHPPVAVLIPEGPTDLLSIGRGRGLVPPPFCCSLINDTSTDSGVRHSVQLAVGGDLVVHGFRQRKILLIARTHQNSVVRI